MYRNSTIYCIYIVVTDQLSGAARSRARRAETAAAARAPRRRRWRHFSHWFQCSPHSRLPPPAQSHRRVRLGARGCSRLCCRRAGAARRWRHARQLRRESAARRRTRRGRWCRTPAGARARLWSTAWKSTGTFPGLLCPTAFVFFWNWFRWGVLGRKKAKIVSKSILSTCTLIRVLSNSTSLDLKSRPMVETSDSWNTLSQNRCNCANCSAKKQKKEDWNKKWRTIAVFPTPLLPSNKTLATKSHSPDRRGHASSSRASYECTSPARTK